MSRPRIVVVGSLNVDYTLRVPRIPLRGETLTASGAMTCFGGKGANQAIAAARAGGDVALIGCVGEDDFGTRYLAHLQAEGIDTTAIQRVATPTGSAFIHVDDAGENCITVNPGANHALTPAHLDQHAALIEGADSVLLQLECPLPAVKRAAEIAHAAGVRVILNPSPWDAAFVSAGIPLDVLIVNQHEATLLGGGSLEQAISDPATTCAHAHCRILIITRGADSTFALTATGESISVMPSKVEPVDTVGAGDTFAGALAVALKAGEPLPAPLAFANTAAALATLKAGAQSAMPLRQAILDAIRPGQAASS